MPTESLLQEFPPVSTEAWEEAIARDLKGADYAKKLIWKTEEGLAVKPYYRAEDIAGLEYFCLESGDLPNLRSARSSGDWRIREEIDATDPEEANRAARQAVAAGAEEIAFSSVAVEHASDLALLLANLEEIPVHFLEADERVLRLLMVRLSKHQASPRISTSFDPLTNLDFAANVVCTAPPTLLPFTLHGAEFEESGATATEEVGFTLAAGVDFLASMQSRNVDLERSAASIEFSFAIGANFFFQIAKLHAFRLLWAQVVESFGGTRPSPGARIHARTSRWNKTIYDSHVNILRGTTEAMSAALGGADSITVAPFDACYKMPDEASSRLARNTQILLKQEALLSRVADPGAGSYYLEVLTDSLAREGWKLMQQIEATGGYCQARAEGRIQRALEQSLAAKESAVASRKRVFTGTNNYADPSERALDRVDSARMTANRRATLGFEQLRLRTERHAAATGKTPRVLLAEFGDVKMRTARSTFAASFFACAGFEIVTQHFDGAAGIEPTDADLIVLCGSDAEYLDLATEVMSKLQALGRKTPVVVAGHPESAEQLLALGVADFVHLRSNPIEFLEKWQQLVGIKD